MIRLGNAFYRYLVFDLSILTNDGIGKWDNARFAY
jgi:hypothetical protein